jgi:hypothetical protein
MYYNEKTGNFAITQPNIIERVMDEVAHEMTEVIIGLDTDYVLIPDKPSEDYIYDGTQWISKAPVVLTPSDLKSLGKFYNGYQVPLDEEAQIAITSIAVQYLTGLFTGTVFHFSNGVKMPISTTEFMDFATWFGIERNKFFL